MKKYSDEERLLNPEFEAGCYDCGLVYDSPSWIEAIVPDEVWETISPTYHKGCGLLCISCIARRCVEAGLDNVPVLFCGTEPLRPVTSKRALYANDSIKVRAYRIWKFWESKWWRFRERRRG